MGDDDLSFDDFGVIDDDVDDVEEDAELELDAPEAAEAADDEPDIEDEDEEPAELGSENKPFTVKNVPEQYATIKVNGEDKVISFKDALNGQMMHSAYSEKMGEVKQFAARAEKVVSETKAQSKQFYGNVMDMLGDESGSKLDAYMEEHFPQAWEAAVSLGAQRMMRVRNGTEEEQRAHWQERQTRTNRRREAQLAQREQAQLRSDQDRTVNDARRDIVAPAAKRALARVGSPDLTQDERTEIWGDMGPFLDMARQKAGRVLTAAEVETVMVRVLRSHGHKPPRPSKVKKAPEVKRSEPRKARKREPKTVNGDPWDIDNLAGS